jgi:hypothetical protein
MRIERRPEHYSPEGQRKLLAMCECMRDYLMKEDVPGFNAYVDSVLAREPDAACFLLEELFEELGFPDDKGTREDLSAELAA